MLIKPKKLSEGDKVAAITLSWGGASEIPHRYQSGKRQLEEIFRLTIVKTRHATRDSQWIESNPKARVDAHFMRRKPY